MLITGTGTTELASEVLIGKCPHCETENSVNVFVHQRYAHVFWVPVFPLKKLFSTQCNHCKQVLELKSLPLNFSTEKESFQSKLKTPLWTFAGLVLAVLFIATIVYLIRKDNAEDKVFIDNPKVGDVYEVRLDGSAYTLYKVAKFTKDSVFVKINEYETDRSSGLYDLKRKGASAYLPDTFGFSKLEIISMFENGDISDVNR